MKVARFSRHVPNTVEEAVSLLADLQTEDCRILAGGQSLVPMMAFRMAQPAHLIDINEIQDLDKTLRVEAGAVRIGALARHAAFRRNGVPGPLGALLSYIVRHIAHDPIRTRGTFCGSLAHADPASEWCLMGATLECEVEVRSRRGIRTIKVDDLLQGLMSTALEADEMIVSASIPLLPENVRCGFYEFARRPGDYALAMALVTIELTDGLISTARVGIGGAEGRPRRVAEAEAALIGQAPQADAFHAAGEAVAAAIDPLEDLQADAEYRRHLARVVTRRALHAAVG